MQEILICRLQDLQSQLNQGRGLNCIDTVIFFLNKGDINKAKACVINEWDKISAYPVLADCLYSFAF